MSALKEVISMHISRYGGEAYLKSTDGKWMKQFMQFTPRMGITVVDQLKLGDLDPIYF